MSSRDPLRPTTLDEFVGQTQLATRLGIILRSAKARGELCDHLLFFGPPGTGKTTLAHIVANELELPLVATSGPVIERPGDIAALLVGLSGPSVVFIDEIHRLPRTAEELLYPAMEDGVLDLLVGEGADARSRQLKVEPFVLVGATTQAGALSAPLRDRFGWAGRLNLYSTDELSGVVIRAAGLLGMEFSAEAAEVLAARSRGTPRVANMLCRRVLDWITVEGVEGTIGGDVVEAALDAFGVDGLGLDQTGRGILEFLADADRPVGVKTIATAVGEATLTIEEVYEPYLVQAGLITRTQNGRVITAAGRRHIGAGSAPGTLPGI